MNKLVKYSILTIMATIIPNMVNAGTITNIYTSGKYTIIQCSVGSNIKVYHDSYGKCKASTEFMSWDCPYAIKLAKSACLSR